jgi:hypothetical protein
MSLQLQQSKIHSGPPRSRAKGGPESLAVEKFAYAREMARGWESKAIEAQQEEPLRDRKRTPVLSEAERERREKRRTLELARARAAEDLTRATAAPHRRMLEASIQAIDQKLQDL